jgi:hypothetical protein
MNAFSQFYIYRNKNFALFVSDSLNGYILSFVARNLGNDPVILKNNKIANLW